MVYANQTSMSSNFDGSVIVFVFSPETITKNMQLEIIFGGQIFLGHVFFTVR